MNKLTILHVSDSHFLGLPDQGRITDALIEAAHKHEQQYAEALKPDICIFSGDLVHGGKKDEFDLGEEWLCKLTSPWHCDTYVVPGNHEVDRSLIDDKLRREYYAAYGDPDAYKLWFDTIKDPGPLTPFFEWHQKAKTRGNISLKSDWTQSTLSFFSDSTIRDIPVRIVGLNTACLSCDDKDRGTLVADVDSLNTCLRGVNTDNQLVIVIGHHPIGQPGDNEKQWLVNWNDENLNRLLLQTVGPHIHFHGHLHTAKASTMSLSTGQYLTRLGAGAVYQGTNWPQKFAFYDIDPVRQQIRPWTYEYSPESGLWELQKRHSYPFRAILPFRLPHVLDRISKDQQQLAAWKRLHEEIQSNALDLSNFVAAITGNIAQRRYDLVLDYQGRHWAGHKEFLEDCLGNQRITIEEVRRDVEARLSDYIQDISRGVIKCDSVLQHWIDEETVESGGDDFRVEFASLIMKVNKYLYEIDSKLKDCVRHFDSHLDQLRSLYDW